MPSKEQLLDIINESPLSATTKDFFTKKVKKEGATEENVVALRELLRAVQHTAFAGMGLSLDPNDKRVKAAENKLKTGVTAANEAYAKTINNLERASQRLAEDIQTDLKHIEQIVVDSAAAEA